MWLWSWFYFKFAKQSGVHDLGSYSTEKTLRIGQHHWKILPTRWGDFVILHVDVCWGKRMDTSDCVIASSRKNVILQKFVEIFTAPRMHAVNLNTLFPVYPHVPATRCQEYNSYDINKSISIQPNIFYRFHNNYIPFNFAYLLTLLGCRAYFYTPLGFGNVTLHRWHHVFPSCRDSCVIHVLIFVSNFPVRLLNCAAYWHYWRMAIYK